MTFHFRCLVFFLACVFVTGPLPTLARIDTAVLTPARQTQAYIYNNADLTLIKDTRTLHFAKGMNPVRFSWAGTRIDPTSLSLEISDPALPLKITQVQFPAGETSQAIWHINAESPCRAEVVIRYFTSGISWQPHYTAILSPDQTRMQWTGQVRIQNRSGMDYPDVRVALVTGNIHLLDRIADLAGRTDPHGRPDVPANKPDSQDMMARGKVLMESAPALALQSMAAAPSPRAMEKVRASDYVVYTLDGEKTLTGGWSEQLVFVQAGTVPVENRYEYDAQRFGDAVIRTVSFTNDADSGLGPLPLPGGPVRVFQAIDSDGSMVFAGTDTMDYIPAGKRHALRLGPDPRITVIPRVMAYAKTNLAFDKQNNLAGFDEIKTMAIHVANFSGEPAQIDIVRTMADPHFTLSGLSGHETFEKIDQHRFKFTITVPAGTRKTIDYTLTTHQGDRKWPSAS
jgi:hypothetical protein